MKFVDEATISVEAGKGGKGCSHFHREKFIQMGGPDGGNGGHGGSIVALADRNTSTLFDFHFRPLWKAEDGRNGQKCNRDGKCAADLEIKLPIGTELYRETRLPDGSVSKELIADLSTDGQRFVLAKGGRGGKGNAFFKSPTNRAPEHAQPGEPGEAGSFLLSLKLVADVGLVGFPNAGKSTLISRISEARPKIADYPFTTITPNLGVAHAPGRAPFVVADVPGLIPGAHEGKGLGIKFLKHVERTRALAHLIDINQLDEQGNIMPVETSYQVINRELELFSPALATMPRIIVLSKVDAVSPEQIEEAKEVFKQMGLPCIAISSVTGVGIKELIHLLSDLLEKIVKESNS